MTVSNPQRLSPDQTAAMLTEIAAMIDAGTSPVGGLLMLEDRRLGRIAAAARRIRGSLERGQALPEAIAAELESTGPHIAAVLQSAFEGGDPSSALLELAHYLCREKEFRRRLLWATLYPFVVITIGYAAFVLSVSFIVSSDGIGVLAPEIWSGTMRESARWISLNWFVPPLVVIGIAIAVLGVSPLRNATAGLLGLARWGRTALFCELVAIQVKQGVELPKAVKLAASATEDPSLHLAAEALNSEVDRGNRPQRLAGIPPLLGWLLLSTDPAVDLSDSLSKLAENYRHRQRLRWSQWTTLLPAMLVIVVGGGMAIGYIMIVLRPVYQNMLVWVQR